jgi:hypothetical protein
MLVRLQCSAPPGEGSPPPTQPGRRLQALPAWSEVHSLCTITTSRQMLMAPDGRTPRHHPHDHITNIGVFITRAWSSSQGKVGCNPAQAVLRPGYAGGQHATATQTVGGLPPSRVNGERTACAGLQQGGPGPKADGNASRHQWSMRKRHYHQHRHHYHHHPLDLGPRVTLGSAVIQRRLWYVPASRGGSTPPTQHGRRPTALAGHR